MKQLFVLDFGGEGGKGEENTMEMMENKERDIDKERERYKNNNRMIFHHLQNKESKKKNNWKYSPPKGKFKLNDQKT